MRIPPTFLPPRSSRIARMRMSLPAALMALVATVGLSGCERPTDTHTPRPPTDDSPLRELALGRPSLDAVRSRITELESVATNAMSGLRTEALWTLGFAGGHEAASALERLLKRTDLSPADRADAIVARALASTHEVGFAAAWTNAPEPDVQHAARFVLGLTRVEGTPSPLTTSEAASLSESGGSPARGRRIFRSAQAGCAKCHVAEGRGAAFGPAFAPTNPPPRRAALLEAILEPSKFLTPGFQAYVVETTEGATHVGMNLVRGTDGSASLEIAASRRLSIPATEVASATPLTASVMPDGLADVLAPEDLRDLLAYLEERVRPDTSN